jgi:hypothetical protein
MATSPKTYSSNNDREQYKDDLTNELTEKLKNGVNTQIISELCERFDALKKASGFDSLNQITAIREKFDALHKTPAISIALDNLNKASELDARKKNVEIMEQQNTLKEITSKVFLSFNLYPMKTFDSNLKKINYPNSIEHAIARDWQNVGNDLWKSYLKVSDNQLSDNDE